MLKEYKKQLAAKSRRGDGDGAGEEEGSDSGSGDGAESVADCLDEQGGVDAAAAVAMLRDPRPLPAGDDIDALAEPGAWGARVAEERLSAAGPAPAAAREHRGPHLAGQSFGGHVNPEGYDWEASAFRWWQPCGSGAGFVSSMAWL